MLTFPALRWFLPQPLLPVRHRATVRRVPARAWVAALLLAWLAPVQGAAAFGFDDAARSAEQLAAGAYKKPNDTMPKELQALTQEQYHDIRMRPERIWWHDAKLPFEVGFFHRGMYFDQTVKINEITDQGVSEIKFDPAMFDYGASKINPAHMGGIGFTGLRVYFALNGKGKDEVLSFLGASYFRALGEGQGYGLSARALAIDTGLPSGEEFPRFVEFWLERPAAGAKELVIYALMDSRRAAAPTGQSALPGLRTAVRG